MKIFTEINFSEEVLKSPLPVIVDFWADWCSPCKMLSPILDEIAKALAGRVIIGKLNVDDNSEIASNYSINSIPTLLFIKNGIVEEQVAGLIYKKALIEKINQVFKLDITYWTSNTLN